MLSHQTEETKVKPTFKGRLALQDFAFRETISPPVRRSPRLATSVSPSEATARSPLLLTPGSSGRSRSVSSRPSVSPVKRKSQENDSDGSTANSPEGTASLASKSNARKRQKSGYAPPSIYAHLSTLPDAMAPNLLVLFVGLNPGIETARTGHAYAHPTNLFWRLLYSSGVTPRLCAPAEDRDMPKLYSLGLTNIVARPSRNGAELSKSEMDAGVEILEAKARRWRPETMCVVGKSIWESIWRVRHRRAIRAHEFRYGWQDESENIGVLGEAGQKADEIEEGVDYDPEWKGARVFVATSTSGLAATLKPPEKERIWRELGSWVEMRREERSAATARS